MADVAHLQSIEKQQEADLAAVSAVLTKAEADIAALSELKAEIANERRAAIRARTEDAIAVRREAMKQRADEAQQALRRHSADALRRAAKFHADPAVDANLRIAAFATLSRTSTPELVEHLADAIDRKDLATAEAVRLEFQNRRDTEGVRERFTELFGKVRVPEAEEAQRSLNRTIGLAGIGDQQFLSALRGRSDPMARLTAHRLAGTPRAA